MIRLLDERSRVEEPIAELRGKPQPLEEPKVELEQSMPTQSEMPIHVLFLEVEDLPVNMERAEPREELLVERVAIQEPYSQQFKKGKTKRHRRWKNHQHLRKMMIRGNDAIRQAKDYELRVPRASLDWVERMSWTN